MDQKNEIIVISERHYVRQIIAVFLATCMFFNAPVVFAATPVFDGVEAGNVTVQQGALNTNVTQTTNGAATRWSNFDIPQNEIVTFTQPTSSSSHLVRINSVDGTTIAGRLESNGRLGLVDGLGVTFVNGSIINVGQLVASGLNITNEDFLAGRYAFSGGNGAVANYGNITATEGVALIGKSVLNAGTISAGKGGFVAMVAGDKVLLGQKTSNIVVESASVVPSQVTGDGLKDGDVINKGVIDVPEGTVVLAAGDIFSRAIDGVDNLPLKVDGGTGRVEQSGTINTDGINSNGGNVTLTAGDEVKVESGSLTSANGGTNGDGGNVIVYAHGTALFNKGATIQAKGGSESGNGGFVEVSGQEVLVAGTADLRASAGQAGTFLLDPHNVRISDDPGSYYNVNVGWLQTQLGLGNFEVATTGSGTGDGDITVLDPINWASAFGLTLDADQDIRVNASITNTANGYLALEADRHIYVDAPIALDGGDIVLNADDAININNAITVGGNMDIIADYDHTLSAPKNAHDYMYSNAPLTAGGNILISGNDIVLGDTVAAGGDMTITGRQCDSDTNPDWGNVWAKKTLTAGGNITISVTGETKTWVDGHWEGRTWVPGHLEGSGCYRHWVSGHWEGGTWIDGYYNYAYEPGKITLDGDVTAISGNLSLFNDTYTGSGVTLKAGHDIYLRNGADVLDPVGYPGYCTALTGTHVLTLWAGNEIVAPDTVISVTGSTLTMHQGLDLNLKDYIFANQSGTDLTLMSDNGSVTADETKLANAADKWQSIGATANQDITFVGNGGSIRLGDSGTAGKSLYAIKGDIDVTAGFNVLATKDMTAGNNLTVHTQHGIDIQAADSGANMDIHADIDTRWGHDVVAHGALDAGGTMNIEGTNVELKKGAHSDGDMTIAAHGLYGKENAPDEPYVAGGDVEVTGEITSGSNITITALGFSGPPSATGPTFTGGTEPYTSDGSIYLHDAVTAGGNITMQAGNNVIVDDPVQSTGFMEIYADYDSDETGDLLAKSSLISGGYLYAYGNNITMEGLVQSASAMSLNADSTYDGSGDLWTKAAVTSGDSLWARGNNITMDGPVQSTTSMTLWADRDMDGSGDLWTKAAVTSGAYLRAYGNNITMDGPVQSTGFMNICVDIDGDGTGDLWTKAAVTSGDSLYAQGNNITIDGPATSEMDMTLVADYDEDGVGNMTANSDLTSNSGSISIYSSDNTTYIGGNVTAYVDVLLNNNTKLNGTGDQRIEAQTGKLIAKEDVDKTTAGNMNLAGGSGIELGDDVSTNNGDLIFENAVMANGSGNQTLDADGEGKDLYALDDITKTTGGDLTLDGGWGSDAKIYLAGDVTANYGRLTLEDDVIANGAGDQKLESGALLNNSTKTLKVEGSVTKTADNGGGSLTLKGEWKTVVEGDITVENGGLTVEADQDVIIDGSAISSDDMVIRADADGDAYLHPGHPLYGGDVIVGGDLTSTGGNVSVYAYDETIYLGGDVTAYNNVLLNNNTKLNGSGDQWIEAQTGKITANGYVHKTTTGDMWMLGGLDGIVDGTADSIDLKKDVGTCMGNLWIIGKNNVQIGGDLTTFPDNWGDDSVEPWFGCRPECRPTGGVAIVSQNGKIYTDGYGDNDTLNVNITGSSNHYTQMGIYDARIYGDNYHPTEGEELAPRASIAIISAADLKIGPDGSLNAYGKYYDSLPEDAGGFAPDDRAAINFLDVPADIPDGTPRDQGEPFDLAIYVASLTGNVDVSSSATIMSCEPIIEEQEPTIPTFVQITRVVRPECELVPKGAMVIDARDTVTFDNSDGIPGGGAFENSLSKGDVGDRLEVCSRITEWLKDAIASDRLPYADQWINPKTGPNPPFPTGYKYVLRGAGAENPEIGDGKPAWVLENPAVLPTAAPLPLSKLPIIEGCPLLMQAVANELSVSKDTIQVSFERSLAGAPSIQPCVACEKLVNYAEVLKDAEGMAALVQAINTMAPAGAPFTPEMGASVAMAFTNARVAEDPQLAKAVEYLDAFVNYVVVMDTELGSPVGDSAGFAMSKYGTAVTESANGNVAAYFNYALQNR